MLQPCVAAQDTHALLVGNLPAHTPAHTMQDANHTQAIHAIHAASTHITHNRCPVPSPTTGAQCHHGAPTLAA